MALWSLMANSARKKVGPYRLDTVLSRDSTGVVYRGYDEQHRRPIRARRLLWNAGESGERAAVRARSRQRVRRAAVLKHPAIAEVFDIYQADDGDWIVTDMVRGETMDKLLGGRGLPVEWVLDYGIQIAEALAQAHDSDIAHGDLQVENIMIDAVGRIRIYDFGLIERIGYSGAKLGEVGSMRALSPEQAGALAVDHRSDLFALGTLLYEALAGVSPFVGECHEETVERVLHQRHAPVAEVAAERGATDERIPITLSELVDQLLKKSPDLRPASANEVQTRLQSISDTRRAQAAAAADEVILDDQATLDPDTGEAVIASALRRMDSGQSALKRDAVDCQEARLESPAPVRTEPETGPSVGDSADTREFPALLWLVALALVIGLLSALLLR